MQWLGLTIDDIQTCLEAPDFVTPSESGRQNFWQRRGTRWLRITVVEEEQQTVIITLTLRRKGPTGDQA